ncbi:Uncharacterized protein Fot_45488 [Forsythia ovata]|uniref:Gnk2-homologous domain-containing protein n=1 Tax=Forsythia ovata TaxID=205694 RepID=A0ABD1RA19_9LAMI
MDSTAPRPGTILIEYIPLRSVEKMFNSIHVVVVSIMPHAQSYNCVLIKKKSILWDTDLCMIRYSNDYIFGTLKMLPTFYQWTVENATSEEDRFYRYLRTLFDSLRRQAVYGGPLNKFAAENRTGPDFSTIYGLVQCTPDLTSEDYSDCLNKVAQNVIPGCCQRKKGFSFFTPGCIFSVWNVSILQLHSSTNTTNIDTTR